MKEEAWEATVETELTDLLLLQDLSLKLAPADPCLHATGLPAQEVD